MGQLEKYGLYVLCLVIFMILGVALWGDPATINAERSGKSGAAIRAVGDQPRVGKDPTASIDGKKLDDFFDIERKETKKDPKSDNPGKGGEPPVVGGSDTPVAQRPTYTIKAGDNFDRIARTQLKDASLRDLIMQLNPAVTPKLMQPGKVLQMPTAAEIAARKVAPPAPSAEADKAKPQDAAGKAAEKPIVPLADAATYYTVKKGDSFERIALNELGSRTRKDELMSLNPGIQPKDLRAGQRIKLPKK